MRVIELDVHRSFAVVAYLEDGLPSGGGRVKLTHDAVIAFGWQLRPDHEVAIANPLQVRAIAHAKVKTDKVDVAVLAKLHASGIRPEVWTTPLRRS
jgi:transposase